MLARIVGPELLLAPRLLAPEYPVLGPEPTSEASQSALGRPA